MKIKFKKSFVKKLQKQVSYISKYSKTNAIQFRTELINEINKLKKFPYICRKSIYCDDENIRDLIFKGYCIVYKINQQEDYIEIFALTKYMENIES